eukprot:Em0011g675a
MAASSVYSIRSEGTARSSVGSHYRSMTKDSSGRSSVLRSAGAGRTRRLSRLSERNCIYVSQLVSRRTYVISGHSRDSQISSFSSTWHHHLVNNNSIPSGVVWEQPITVTDLSQQMAPRAAPKMLLLVSLAVNRTTKMMSGNAPEPKKRDAVVRCCGDDNPKISCHMLGQPMVHKDQEVVRTLPSGRACFVYPDPTSPMLKTALRRGEQGQGQGDSPADDQLPAMELWGREEGLEGNELSEIQREMRLDNANLKKEVKTELSELKKELKTDLSEMRKDNVNLKKEVKTELSEVKKELKTDLSELNKELKTDLSEVKKEFKMELSEVKKELKTDLSEMRKLLESFLRK